MSYKGRKVENFENEHLGSRGDRLGGRVQKLDGACITRPLTQLNAKNRMSGLVAEFYREQDFTRVLRLPA
jgi:hypothetical protein